MKKRLLFLVALFVTTMAFACDFEIDCICYNLDYENKTAEVDGPTYSGWECQYSSNKIVIPEKVTCNGVEYSVISIGDYAFYECSSLTSITIPQSVTSIGYNAFYGCSSLISVNISDLVAWFNISFSIDVYYGGSSCHSNPLQYAKKLYLNGELVTDLVIPEGVNLIQSYAFHGCSSLTSIIIPQSVTSIGSNAFHGCSSLTSITIPQSVTSIGSDAFYGCTGLMLIDVDKDNQNYASIDGVLYDKNITNLICCPGAVGKTSIEIPKNVTSIEAHAFHDCNGIISITWNAIKCNSAPFYNISAQITSFTFGDSVSYIPDRLCSNMQKLTSIEIPNSVVEVGGGIFEDCESLESVILSENITSLLDYYDGWSYGFFENCKSLKTIVIPKSVTLIGDYTFEDCSSLTSIIIPNSVISIGDNAFSGCDNLRTVEIGNSIETLGNSAFEECTGIYSIKINAIVPPFIKDDTFMDVSRTAQIKVPCGAMAAYQGSTYWNEFTNYIESPYSLSVEVNDNTMGMAVVTKQNTCTDITATVQAQARPGYEFVKWSDGFTENPHTVFVMEDMTITAEFAPMAKEYTINVNCDKTKGSVTGSGIYKEGESITIKAIANENYHFVKWSDGNSENPRTIVVTEDVELTAEFELDGTSGDDENYIFIVESADKAQGSVEIIITAKAIEGFEFDHWSDGSTENPRVVTLDVDVELYAYFRVAETTNVENSMISAVNVYGSNGVLYVEGVETDYHVLDASGRVIYSGRDAQLSLPRGVYVIAVGGEVEKVVL